MTATSLSGQYPRSVEVRAFLWGCITLFDGMGAYARRTVALYEARSAITALGPRILTAERISRNRSVTAGVR